MPWRAPAMRISGRLRRLNVLPKETDNYVPVILAMIIVSKNAKDYGLDEIDPDSPSSLRHGGTGSSHQSGSRGRGSGPADRGVEGAEPGAAEERRARRDISCAIPSGTLDQLEQAFAAIPPNQRDSWRVHRVESGDTAATLAKRYGTTAETIASANRGEIPGAGSLRRDSGGYPGDRRSGEASVQ